MKILINENWVDLEAPIFMSEEQRKRFIDFFYEHFDGVEIGEVEEATKHFGSKESTMKVWTEDDLLMLLSPKDNTTLTTVLKRSDMSVKMKRGDFVPKFWKWMKDKGLSPPADKEMIRAFITEVYEK